MCRFSKLLLFSFFFCKDGSDRLMKRPFSLVVIFFALCLLLLTWSIAGVACRACHSSCTFFLCDTHTRARARVRGDYLPWPAKRDRCLFCLNLTGCGGDCDSWCQQYHGAMWFTTHGVSNTMVLCGSRQPCACCYLLGVYLVSLAIRLALSFHCDRHTHIPSSCSLPIAFCTLSHLTTHICSRSSNFPYFFPLITSIPSKATFSPANMRKKETRLRLTNTLNSSLVPHWRAIPTHWTTRPVSQPRHTSAGARKVHCRVLREVEQTWTELHWSCSTH